MISNITHPDTARYGLPACWRMLYLNRKLRMKSIVVVCGLVIGILSKCDVLKKKLNYLLYLRGVPYVTLQVHALTTICDYMSLVSTVYFIRIHSKYVRYIIIQMWSVRLCLLSKLSQLTQPQFHNYRTVSFLSGRIETYILFVKYFL